MLFYVLHHKYTSDVYLLVTVYSICNTLRLVWKNAFVVLICILSFY